MTVSKRITVRLGAGEVARLQEIGREAGTDISAVVRTALTPLFNRSPNTPGRTDRSAAPAAQTQIPVAAPASATTTDGGLLTVAIKEPADSKAGPSAPAQQIPPKTAAAVARHPRQSGLSVPVPLSLADLVSEARGLGMELKKARRLQFQRCAAATAVATESAETPQEAELYAELARIGRLFGLLS